MDLNSVLILAVSLVVLGGIYFFLKKQKKTPQGTPENLLEELRQQLATREKLIEDLRGELSTAEEAKIIAQTKLEEALRSNQEQKDLLNRTEEKLVTTFQALSGESLKSNNKAFLELAQEALEVVLSKAKGQIGEKEESIKNIVGSLDTSLKKYEKQVTDFELKRREEYGSLDEQIKSLASMNQQLQKETGNLVSALRRPEVRGRWGEVTLKRVVELSGMSEHCDFTEQVSVTTEDGRIRPDMIVHLPAKRDIVVDSKVSLSAYLDATSADSEEVRKELMLRHGQQVRKHMRDLAAKGYWEQFDHAPEFVVMFIPGESFLSAALEQDHTLIEDGMKDKVIIATPTTLIALLRAIAFGWRQEEITKNAHVVADLGQELYERFGAFLGHVGKTSNSLDQSIFNFNRMVASLEGRILPSVRKFKELGATGSEELPEVKPLDQTPRKLQVTEVQSIEDETSKKKETKNKKKEKAKLE